MQCELAFEIGDLFFPLGYFLFPLRKLFPELLILLLQSFNLLRLAIRRGVRPFAAWQPLLSPGRHQP